MFAYNIEYHISMGSLLMHDLYIMNVMSNNPETEHGRIKVSG